MILRQLCYVLNFVLLPVLGVLLLLDYVERFAWWLGTGVDPGGCTWTWQAILSLAKVSGYLRNGQWPVQ